MRSTIEFVRDNPTAINGSVDLWHNGTFYHLQAYNGPQIHELNATSWVLHADKKDKADRRWICEYILEALSGTFLELDYAKTNYLCSSGISHRTGFSRYLNEKTRPDLLLEKVTLDHTIDLLSVSMNIKANGVEQDIKKCGVLLKGTGDAVQWKLANTDLDLI
ncbi:MULTISPECIES: hypothetical protein [unclassified Rhizobium]|uniref:hypothetical protein n=1 Tax=unclassified Rhizobium TaxID=2613769 RepID=UPI00115EFCE2|nr:MULTISPECIES: hypothetical protein [unclassified Rhizobium]TQX90257.1 hypothetical protein EQW76_11175 [Rhizobium sp. rho-13.1]TQY16207.1 hypothetical protein EQW74_10765 [Rhizobium sp. rho-1.1]